MEIFITDNSYLDTESSQKAFVVKERPENSIDVGSFDSAYRFTGDHSSKRLPVPLNSLSNGVWALKCTETCDGWVKIKVRDGQVYYSELQLPRDNKNGHEYILIKLRDED